MNSYWLYVALISLGIVAVLLPIGVVAAGAWVRRIRWADRAVLGGLLGSAVIFMALLALDNFWYRQSGQRIRAGLFFGLGWAGSGLVLLAPVAILVARRRVARGWPREVSGLHEPHSDGGCDSDD